MYGIFRALKKLQHRVWGVLFCVEHDAQSVAQMLRSVDDVPNAPILRWISWIRLFDFKTKHVPATALKLEDGLSRRKPSPQDQPYDEIDMEEFLKAYNNNTLAKFLFDELYFRYSNSFMRNWNENYSSVPLLSTSVISETLSDYKFCIPPSPVHPTDKGSFFAASASRNSDMTPPCQLPEFYH